MDASNEPAPVFNNIEQPENLNAPDLDAIVNKWRWLVPSDVEIHIRWCPDLADWELAKCHYSLELSRMLIRVTPYEPTYFAEGFEFPRNVEADVVHELLHWRFAGFMPKCDDDVQYSLWEGAVERTAQDLIRMNRKGI